MKKHSFILLLLLLSFTVVMESSFMAFSSMYTYVKTEASSCCEAQTSHCHSESTKKQKSKACTNTENCAMPCCIAVYYLPQNEDEVIYASLQIITKELIVFKPSFYKKDSKSDWFHPPEFV